MSSRFGQTGALAFFAGEPESSQRATLAAASAATVVAANGTGTAQVLLGQLEQGSDLGIWFERGDLVFVPADTTGSLQITDAFLGITAVGGTQQPLVSLAIPIATLTAPRAAFGSPVATLTSQFVKVSDILTIGAALAALVPGQNVQVSAAVGVKNSDAVNPHNFSISANVEMRLLRGLRE